MPGPLPTIPESQTLRENAFAPRIHQDLIDLIIKFNNKTLTDSPELTSFLLAKQHQNHEDFILTLMAYPTLKLDISADVYINKLIELYSSYTQWLMFSLHRQLYNEDDTPWLSIANLVLDYVSEIALPGNMQLQFYEQESSKLVFQKFRSYVSHDTLGIEKIPGLLAFFDKSSAVNKQRIENKVNQIKNFFDAQPRELVDEEVAEKEIKSCCSIM